MKDLKLTLTDILAYLNVQMIKARIGNLVMKD